MKRIFHSAAVAIATLPSLVGTVGTVGTVGAQAAPVADTYVGGTVSGCGDIFGHASIFDVRGFEARRAGTRLHVQVDTSFAGDAGVYPGLTNTPAGGGFGIGYGDVFLGSGWTPFGPAPYLADNHATSTRWTYAFSLDNRWRSTGGTGRLYRLGGATNNENALLSDDFLSGGIHRRGQVIAVDRASSTVEMAGTGTWSVDGPNSRLLFDFDLAGSSLANDGSLALHWAVTCGNDVVEGVAQVRTPVTAPLFALGLLAGLFGRGVRGRAGA